MRRLLALALLVPLTAVAAPLAAPVHDAVGATKKRGCATFKTAKARKDCRTARSRSRLRKGQVCSLSAAKQRQYRRLGFVCVDVSAGQDGSLTFLEDR